MAISSSKSCPKCEHYCASHTGEDCQHEKSKYGQGLIGPMYHSIAFMRTRGGCGSDGELYKRRSS